MAFKKDRLNMTIHDVLLSVSVRAILTINDLYHSQDCTSF